MNRLDYLKATCTLNEHNTCLTWPYKHPSLKFMGKTMHPARVAWILTHGFIADDVHIRHKCRGADDGCYRASHIEAGSHQDNMDDKYRDGTVTYGILNPKSKLTTVQIEMIRDRRHEPLAVLARHFFVKPSTIRAVLTGRTWSWYPLPR